MTQGLVLDAQVQGTDLRGHMKASPKEQFHTVVGEQHEDLDKAMLAAHVNFSKKDAQSNLLLPILFNVGPFVLLGAIWFFMRSGVGTLMPVFIGGQGSALAASRRVLRQVSNTGFCGAMPRIRVISNSAIEANRRARK